MKNELKINGCDYWGTYDGYKIYKCYSKAAPSYPNYPNFVFAIGTNLYMNGEVIGKVDSAGRVRDWDPSRAKKKKEKFDFFVPEERAPELQNDNVISSAEELLELALKRSIEDLVGPSLAN